MCHAACCSLSGYFTVATRVWTRCTVWELLLPPVLLAEHSRGGGCRGMQLFLIPDCGIMGGGLRGMRARAQQYLHFAVHVHRDPCTRAVAYDLQKQKTSTAVCSTVPRVHCLPSEGSCWPQCSGGAQCLTALHCATCPCLSTGWAPGWRGRAVCWEHPCWDTATSLCAACSPLCSFCQQYTLSCPGIRKLQMNLVL